MKTFKQLYYEKYSILNERYIDDAWGYYIDASGIIHDVDGDHMEHFAQIEDDYNLINVIPNEVWPDHIGDDARYVTWMVKWMKKNQMYAIVYDITNKIVYVRSGPRDLNELQRKSIVDFCIKKKSELVYDSSVLA